MATGLVLVFAILILGGVIATVGDRLGSKVGKARLSLFKLRPRRTATLITILTGSIISASTLGILFATSSQLRTGVFELGKIQQRLSQARQDLATAVEEKQEVESQLNDSRFDLKRLEGEKRQAEDEKKQAEARLNETRTQLASVTEQVIASRSEIATLQSERQALIAQRDNVKAQIAERDRDIAQRDRAIAQRDQSINQRNRELATREQELAQRNQDIARRDQQIAQRDADIRQRNQQIAQREMDIRQRDQRIIRQEQEVARRDRILAQRSARLKELETQQAFLERRIELLAQNYQGLREGNVAIARGQVLAFAVVRIPDQQVAYPVVDQLLQESNRLAIQLIQPGTSETSEQIVQITEGEVKQLVEEIQDNREYVVRVISVGNYVLGEKNIRILIDAAPNRLIFQPGETLATASINLADDEEQRKLSERIEFLVEASKFRARRVGFLGETLQIGDGKIETLIRFINTLRQYQTPVEVRVLVRQKTFSAGPLWVDLIVIQNGEVILKTS